MRPYFKARSGSGCRLFLVLDSVVRAIDFDNTEVYRKLTDDPDFKSWLTERRFNMDYDKRAA
ncbi:hypothetical protein QUA44_16170 [Microcoleus sp. N9_A2]|uniref:hypothetical protein n=1 Tax=unclassified Microcoleus TaxID=2642155 RepID=UPI002FD74351